MGPRGPEVRGLEVGKKWARSELKVGWKWVERGFEVGWKLARSGSEVGRKWIGSGPEVEKLKKWKSVQNFFAHFWS